MKKKHHLSSKNFIDLLKGEKKQYKTYQKYYRDYKWYKNSVVLENIVVTESIKIDKEDIFPLPIIIGDVEFESLFRVFGGKFYKDFIILGGQFQSDFIISGGEFQSDFRLYQGEFQSEFIVYRGEFQKYFRIYGGEFQGEFRVSGGKFYKDFRVLGGKFQSEFIISQGQYQSNFRIFEGEFQSDFMILGGEFQNDFIISEGEFQGNFIVSEGELQNDFRILGGQFRSDFIISGGQFQKSFKISGGEFQRCFRISGGEFQRDFRIDGGEFNNIFFSSPKIFLRRLIIIMDFIAFLSIEGIIINELILAETFKSSGVAYFKNLQINRLHFEQLVNLGKLFFLNISVKVNYTHTVFPVGISVLREQEQYQKLEDKEVVDQWIEKNNIQWIPQYIQKIQEIEKNYRKVKNKTKIKIPESVKKVVQNYRQNVNDNYEQYEVREFKADTDYKKLGVLEQPDTNNGLCFEDSTLGNVEFKNVAFTDFDEIQVSATNFSNVTFYEGYLPYQKECIQRLVKDKQEEKDSDTQQQLEHQTLSETYTDLFIAMKRQENKRLAARYYGAKQEHTLQLLDTSKTQKVSIYISKFFSNYGQNWLRALAITLGLGSVFFVAFVLSLPNVVFHFPKNWSELQESANIASYYFQFFNPTHRINFMQDISPLSGFSRVWDFLGRIVIGIGLYEVVRAFRMFAKK